MKGTVLDIVFVLAMVFIFSICVFLGLHVLNNFETETATSLNNTVSREIIDSAQSTLIGFNNLFPFVILGLGLGVIISAFLIQTHPAFFVVSFILLIFVILVSTMFGNIFFEFASADVLATETANFGWFDLIWRNIPVITLFIGIITLVVLYGKSGGIRGQEF